MGLRPDEGLALTRLLERFSPDRRAQVYGWWRNAGGGKPAADAGAERALLARALLARPIDAPRFAVLEALATSLRGLPRAELRRVTTLIDSDVLRNTSGVDTYALLAAHPRAALGRDPRTDNDGSLQRYEVSCGPAVAEVLLGKLDPSYAFAVHRAGGPQDLSPDHPSAVLQRRLLGLFGITPIERRGLHDYRRLRALCAELVETGALSNPQRLALLRYARHPRAERPPAAALAVVRRKAGFPGKEALARMRASAPAAREVGTDAVEMRQILRATFSGTGHLRTATRVLAAKRSSRHFVERHVTALARAAKRDGAVLGTTDHWWAVVDARGEAGGRELLIHDPWTGTTAWVPQAELADGRFARTRFGWRQRERVDTLILVRVDLDAAQPDRPKPKQNILA